MNYSTYNSHLDRPSFPAFHIWIFMCQRTLAKSRLAFTILVFMEISCRYIIWKLLMLVYTGDSHIALLLHQKISKFIQNPHILIINTYYQLREICSWTFNSWIWLDIWNTFWHYKFSSTCTSICKNSTFKLFALSEIRYSIQWLRICR